MHSYHDLLRNIMANGIDRDDRTGVGTRSIFGAQMRCDLSKGFPLLTTKKVFLKGIIHELLWFLSGDTNIRYLVQNNVHIRDERPFAVYLRENKLNETFPRYSEARKEEKKAFVQRIIDDEDFAQKWGDLGPVYGKQRRRRTNSRGEEIDQIANVVDQLRNSPNSRRIIVSGRNVGDIQDLIADKDGAPPPCHSLYQFRVANNKLSCQLYQRSCDVFLGLPFNIASYALLTMMLAQVTGLELGEFVRTGGDTHLYKNHFDQVQEQLSRTPKDLPTMTLNPAIKEIGDFSYEDFTLENYDPYPSIKAPIAV